MKEIIIFILLSFIIISFHCCSPVEDNGSTIDEPGTEVEIEGDQFILKNNSISLEFRKISNKLKLVNLSSGDNSWINSELVSKEQLWKLTFFSSNSKTSHVINSQDVDLKKVTKTNTVREHFIFQWEFKIGTSTGIVYATVGLNNATGLSEWDLEVELPNGWEVTDVTYPMLSITKDAGMHLITPSGWGAEYALDNISNLRLPLTYPSSRATVQLMCLNNNQRTLYFAAHDNHANLKTLAAQIAVTQIELAIETVASKGWNKENEFSLPWTAQVGVHNNGWENAVLEWYRPFALKAEWGKKTLQSKNIPQWLQDTDLWLHGGRTGQDELSALDHTLTYFGNDTKYHWYYWSSHDFDTNYPEYMPPRENYDKVVELIHQKGSRVMPYTNGRLWDISSVSYQSMNGANEVVLKKDNQPYIETYASGAQNAVVCPSSNVWNNIIIGFTQDILNATIRHGGLYYDQVASASALPCYNEDHDHPPGGGDFWHYSYRKIFTNIKNYVDSDQIICTEQNAECFTDLFDLFLMGNTPMGRYWSPAPLFPLIYSDRVLTYGFYLNNPNDISYRVKSALSLLWGAQLNGGRSVLYVSPSWQENAIFLKGLKTFRQRHHDLFVGGRFMGEVTPEGDNPNLNIDGWDRPSRAIRGAKWVSTQGGEAIVFVNLDTQDHQIVLPNGRTQNLKAGECYRHNL